MLPPPFPSRPIIIRLEFNGFAVATRSAAHQTFSSNRLPMLLSAHTRRPVFGREPPRRWLRRSNSRRRQLSQRRQWVRHRDPSLWATFPRPMFPRRLFRSRPHRWDRRRGRFPWAIRRPPPHCRRSSPHQSRLVLSFCLLAPSLFHVIQVLPNNNSNSRTKNNQVMHSRRREVPIAATGRVVPNRCPLHRRHHLLRHQLQRRPGVGFRHGHPQRRVAPFQEGQQ